MKTSNVTRDGSAPCIRGDQWRRKAIGAACVLLAAVVVGIWMILCGDTASPWMLLVAGCGVFNQGDLVAKLRSRTNGATSIDSEAALLDHLKDVFRLGMKALHAKNLVMALWNRETGERLQWKVKRTAGVSLAVAMRPEESLPPASAELWYAMYVRNQRGIASLGVSWNEQPMEGSRVLEYLDCLWRGRFKTLMLCSLDLGSRWKGMVAFVDPDVSPCAETVWETLGQIMSTIRSGSELSRVACAAARVREREQVARDLHDGVTQSLIATELQIAVLERQACAAGGQSDAVFHKVRDTLRREARKLRLEIEELQRGEPLMPLGIKTYKLLREFEIDTGIETSCECEITQECISPRLACEVSYLLQAALSNVRRHSEASRVDVRLRVEDGVYLHVQDNGRGLGFSGRYDLAMLAGMKDIPRTICERVQAGGGRLMIETFPGKGVRLEAWLPLSLPDGAGISDLMATPRMLERKASKSIGGADYLKRAS